MFYEILYNYTNDKLSICFKKCYYNYINNVTYMEEFNEIDLYETKILTEKELKNIGRNLHYLRCVNDLTLLDVAFYTFTNVTSVWKLEKGLMKNITLCTLIKMCQLFNITLKDLLIVNDNI